MVPSMDKRILWPVVIVLVIGLIAIFLPRRAADPPDVPTAEPDTAPEVMEPPEFTPFGDPLPDPEPPPPFVQEELPEPAPQLPDLDESDAEAQQALAEAAGPELVEGHMFPDGLVRRIVVTVDNLPREDIWVGARAVAPIEGRFLVEGTEDEPVIAPGNFARYSGFVQRVEQVDVEALTARYQRYYPLLQEAYEELGFPGRQFHNRALDVIDHLLATPQVEGPIRLEQPHVLYTFADPELEALSPGQKVMLRVGPQNAATLRAKLLELREALVELERSAAD
jgi:hypothetical protein